MAIIQGNSKSASGFDTTLIEDSVWLENYDYFTKTNFGNGTGQPRLVFAAWIKRTKFSATDQTIFNGIANYGGSWKGNKFLFHADHKIEIYIDDVAGTNATYQTDGVFRDVGWYHLILSIDATVTDSVQLYVNGIKEETLTLTSGTALAAAPGVWGHSGNIAIGTDLSLGNPLYAYVAQPVFLAGESIQSTTAVTDILDSFEFGTSGSQFGPKSSAAITTLAANAFSEDSFALDFSDSAHLGHDSRPHNLLAYSEQLDQWTASGTTAVANAMVAPDGSQTMDTLRVTTGSSNIWENRQSIHGVVETSSVYTVSGYFKHDGTNRPIISFINPTSPYNNMAELGFTWSGGTPTQSHFTGTGTPVFTDVGNDIWRISFQVTTHATATDFRVNVFPNGGYLGTDVVGVWGMQVEQGGLSPYVPTPKNVLLRTEEFDNAYWSKIAGATITADQAVAPDGTTTAELATAGNALHGSLFARRYLTSAEVVPSTKYTLSCYVKKINYRYIQLRQPNSRSATFDFDTKTFVGVTSDIESTGYEDVGNNWYRIHSTYTQASSITNFIVDIAFANSSGTSGFTPAGTETVYIWGAQFETGGLSTYRKISSTAAVNVVPNNFTPTSMSAANQSSSSPSNDVAILNKLIPNTSIAYSEGNTKLTHTGGTTVVPSTIFTRSGKFYAEVLIGTTGTWFGYNGVVPADDQAAPDWALGATDGYLWVSNGTLAHQGATPSISTTYGNGDRLMFGLDMDNGWLFIGKNNVWYDSSGSSHTDLTSSSNAVATNLLTVSSDSWTFAPGASHVSGTTTEQIFLEASSWAYTAPANFVQLSSSNLPTPELQGVDNFSVTLGTEAAVAPTENLIKNSEDLSAASWFDAATVTVNQAANPIDGAVTADLIARSATNGKRVQSHALTSGATYIHSAYFKNVSVSNGVTRMWMWESAAAYANLIWITWTSGVPAVTYNQNFGGLSPAGGSTIEDVGDGWYRISYVAVPNNSNSLFVSFECSTSGTGESLYVWGVQLELAKSGATTPSTYVPTYTNTAASLPYSEKLNLIDNTTTENYIRNNTMEGVLAGTPGTAPTHWGVYGNGTTVETVGYGVTADGVEYVDIKFSGTPTSDPYINFDGVADGILTSPSQLWSMSSYIALQAGSMTNITNIQFVRADRTITGGYITAAAPLTITPTSALNRYEAPTTTSSGGTVARVTPKLNINWDGSGAIDATFRIGNPQMEKRSSASPVIKTSQYTMNHNLALQSQTMDNATWVKSGCGVSANVAVAPDGTTTAEGIQALNSVSSEKRLSQTLSTQLAGTFITGSFYVKAARLSFVAVTVYNSVNSKGVRRFVNLTNGAIGTNNDFNVPAEPAFAVETVGNGWYRISASMRLQSPGAPILRIQPALSDGNLAYVASESNVDEIYVWGAQFEKTFNSPRTYLPTTTAAVFEPTRRTSLNSFVEIQKNRTASETWAWRFNDYDKEYAVSTTATYQDIRAQTGTNNWLSHAIRIAPDAGTAAGAVSHGFATGHTVVTHGLTSSRYAVLLFPRANGNIHFYHPDLAAGKLLVLNSDAGEITSDAIRDITTTSFSIDSGVAQGVYDYLVLEDGGLASMGTYIGNNSGAGPYISLPHSSALFTRRSAAVCSFWTNNSKSPGYNENGNYTRWNDGQAEGTGSLKIDMLSGAVKIRDAYGDQNASGVTYYYISLGELSGGGDLPPIYGR